MAPQCFHLSDQDLLLLADGELSRSRIADARRHLASCWACRARVAELESTITDFMKFCHRPQELPPIEGPRALLRARMADIAGQSEGGRRHWAARLLHSRAAPAALILMALSISLLVMSRLATLQHQPQPAEVPRPDLTPGATLPVRVADICREAEVADDPAVPLPLKNRVFEEYGLSERQSNLYEIDFLISGKLGGAADIRNLWPQPYFTTPWNAIQKDALETRLHSLVCSGDVDLTTAQHEISGDWISAYKKYFHTNRPLREHTGWNNRREAMLIFKSIAFK